MLYTCICLVTDLATDTLADICSTLSLPPECWNSYTKLGTAQDTAEEILTSTALRSYDIWLPGHQRYWLLKLLTHIWPEKYENFETFFPKNK